MTWIIARLAPKHFRSTFNNVPFIIVIYIVYKLERLCCLWDRNHLETWTITINKKHDSMSREDEVNIDSHPRLTG